PPSPPGSPAARRWRRPRRAAEPRGDRPGRSPGPRGRRLDATGRRRQGALGGSDWRLGAGRPCGRRSTSALSTARRGCSARPADNWNAWARRRRGAGSDEERSRGKGLRSGARASSRGRARARPPSSLLVHVVGILRGVLRFLVRADAVAPIAATAPAAHGELAPAGSCQ
ncbi:unnamed protein product, partial [Prorocentrum cordatum]